MKSKSIYTLRSIAVVLSLLAEVATKSWESMNIRQDEDAQTTQIYTTVSRHLKLYSKQPLGPFPREKSLHAVQFLLKIKPVVLLKNSLSIIFEPSSSSESLSTSNETQELLENIDISIERVLQYFSASNWNEVYPEVQAILRSATNNRTEDVEYLPGIEIVSLLYLDASKAHFLLEDILTILPDIKRSTHRYALELFLMKALTYWMFTQPHEFAYASQQDTPLSRSASQLFDMIYSSSNEDKRKLPTWNILSLLISFSPSAFSSYGSESRLSLKSSRTSFKIHSSKKKSFISCINGLLSKSSDGLFNEKLASATKSILKASSILQVLEPASPIVSFCKSLYNPLKLQIFLSPSKTGNSPDLHLFQANFITTFIVVNPDGILRDIFPLLNSKDEFMYYIPNILQGIINNRQIPIFREQYSYTLDKISKLLRDILTKTSVQLRYFENQSNFLTELKESKLYKNYVDTISKCFTIFAYDYRLFTKDYIQIVDLGKDEVFSSIVNCSLSYSQEVQDTSLTFIKIFLNISRFQDFKVSFADEKNMFNISITFSQCGALGKYHAKRILDKNLDDDEMLARLKVIKMAMQTRCNIISHCHLAEYCGRHPEKIEILEQRESVSTSIETAIYVALCSTDTSVCKMALEILNILVEEAFSIEDMTNIDSSVWSIAPYLSLYSQFSSPSYMITGSIAVQKRLYGFLQKIKHPTAAIVRAWKIILERWRILTKVSIQSSSVNREKIKLWRSYSGFLCSVLLPSPEQSIHQLPSLTSYSSMTIETINEDMEEYLKELISLLTLVKSPFLRESAREVLAKDTSHTVYPFLFRTLEIDIQKRLKASGNTLFEQDFLCIEQSVMLMRSVINTNRDSSHYWSVDMGPLTLIIVKCLHTLPVDDRVLQLRIQFCYLIESITNNRDTLNMRRDISVRNEVTSVFADWLDKCLQAKFSDTLSTISSNASSTRSIRKNTVNSDSRLQRNLICAIIQSYVVILNNLKLEPPDVVHEMDLIEAKAQRFSALYSLFVRILEKCRLEELNSPGNLGLGDKLNSVKSMTIECASNLLTSNREVGLKFALPLAMKNDPFIRVSFIKILDNLLASENLPKSGFSETQPFQDLADFLSSNIQLILSICDICPASEVDEFSKALINIFEAKFTCLKLVRALVKREIEKADTPLEVLRRNCVATKILSLYAHDKGLEYLKLTINPLYIELTENPEIYTFDSSPDKLQVDLEQNFANCERILKKLIVCLQKSTDDVPVELRLICKTISNAVMNKFPTSKDSTITAISAFFLLRFICPALVSPEAHNLSDNAPDPIIRKTLLNLAKIIQNMAFGSTSFVKFSIFKHHPTSFGPNSMLIMQFLRSLSVVEPEDDDDNKSSKSSLSASSNASRSCSQQDIDIIHRFFFNHWEEISHRLLFERRTKHKKANEDVDSITSDVSADSDDAEVRIFQRLTSLVRNLGRPRSTQLGANPGSDISASLENAPKLQEFLSRNANRDMSPVIERRIITEGVTKDGMPLLILNTRFYDTSDVDTELVVCRFFQVASRMWKQKFAIFVDNTGHSPENSFPMSARSVSDMLITEDMIRNIQGVYFLNVSTDYLPHLKSMIKHYYAGIFMNPSRIQYKFLTTNDIPNLFNENIISLASTTVSVVRDVRIIFNNVYRYNPSRNGVTQITLKLGNEHIQLRSQEAFHYVKSSPGYTNDIILLSDVEGVYTSNSNKHPDEFTLELKSSGVRKIILHCSKRHEIIRAIQTAKEKLVPSLTKKNSLVISPTSSLAALLNISFSGLCSENSLTQEASYNLLAAIQYHFDINFGIVVEAGKGLKLPTNVFARIEKASESVAKARPEITMEVIKYSFDAFHATSINRRQGVIIYIIPWAKNMVELARKETGDSLDKELAGNIRKLIEVSVSASRDYMFLLQDIWPLIMAEPVLASIAIDEVVYQFAGNDISPGAQMDAIVSIATCNPTIGCCRMIMDRIRKIALENTDRGVSLPKNSDWKELIIHVTSLSAILFENPETAKEFFPELSLCIMLYLNTGPYWFRTTVFSLIINILQSFLNSEMCDEEASDHLHTIWDELNGTKGNMIFGISEEMKSLDYDYPVTSTIFQVDACATILYDMAGCIVSQRTVQVYRSIIIPKLLIMGKVNYSSFQGRSLLILGSLGRVEVSDKVMSSVLDIFYNLIIDHDDYGMKDELLTCLSFCLSKMADGLRLDSKYLPRLFWVSIALMQTKNMNVFVHALQLLQTTLKSLDEYGAFKNADVLHSSLLSYRNEVKAEYDALEKFCKIKFDAENFETQLSAVLIPGLRKSTTRAATLSVFETLLSFSARCNSQSRDTDANTADLLTIRDRTNSSTSIAQFHANSLMASANRRPSVIVDDDAVTVSSMSVNYAKFPRCMPYLCILYIGARNVNELRDYLWIAGFSEEDLNSNEIPPQIKLYLQSGENSALLTLYLCIMVFAEGSGNDELLDSRVLACLNHFGEVNTEDFFKLYFVARPKIQTIIDSGPSLTHLKYALDVVKIGLLHVEVISRSEDFTNKMDAILRNAGLDAITNANRFKNASNADIQQHWLLIGNLFKSIADEVVVLRDTDGGSGDGALSKALRGGEYL